MNSSLWRIAFQADMREDAAGRTLPRDSDSIARRSGGHNQRRQGTRQRKAQAHYRINQQESAKTAVGKMRNGEVEKGLRKAIHRSSNSDRMTFSKIPCTRAMVDSQEYRFACIRPLLRRLFRSEESRLIRPIASAIWSTEPKAYPRRSSRRLMCNSRCMKPHVQTNCGKRRSYNVVSAGARARTSDLR